MALPFLKSALFKHLERFPSLRNGLGREASLCLKLVADGHSEFKALFPAFGKREPLYGFGDAQVFLELKTFGERSASVAHHERRCEPNGFGPIVRNLVSDHRSRQSGFERR